MNEGDAEAGARVSATACGRVPLVLQMEAAECGAACLAMVLAHYGCPVPLEELRGRCGVSRDGSRAGNLVRAAEGYGLVCSAFQAPVEALWGEALPCPQIVLWESRHYVVLEGRKRGKVLLCDPACGRRMLTLERFARHYSGVTLCFTPGPNFRRSGQAAGQGAVALWWARLRFLRGSILTALFCSVLFAAAGLLAADALRGQVDGIKGAGAPIDWTGIGCRMGLAGALALGASWLRAAALRRLRRGAASEGAARFLWRMLRLPVAFFARRYPAAIGGRMVLNERLAQLLAGPLATGAGAVVLALTVLPGLWYCSPVLAGATMAGGVVALLPGLLLRRSLQEAGLEQSEHQSRLAAALAGTFQTIATIKARAQEEMAFRGLASLHAGVLERGRLAERQRALRDALAGGWLLLMRGGVLLGGVWLVRDGGWSAGTLAAYLLLQELFLLPLTQAAQSVEAVSQAVGATLRLEDVLSAQPDGDCAATASFPLDRAQDERIGTQIQDRVGQQGDAPDALSTKVVTQAEGGLLALPLGRLEFRAVTFGYSPLEAPLLEDVSFVLEPGRRLALVGPSGCGKSTILRLAAGLCRPWGGEVRMDQRRREEWAPEDLHAAVALAGQETLLFSGTVRENLTLWDRTIREADLTRACRDACLQEDLARRAGGFGARVLEQGENFSGGQRQQLELARALCGNPRLLLLDEATSALDPEVEERIMEHLRERGCACLIAAHRLSTVRGADEILFLDRGRVVERGTHASLMAQNGRYAALMRLQESGSGGAVACGEGTR